MKKRSQESTYVKEKRKEYNDLRKTANQRLRRLSKSEVKYGSRAYRYLTEKLSNQQEYLTQKKGILQFKPLKRGYITQQELEHKLAIISKFVKAKTSTITGTKELYKKGYRKFLSSHENIDISYNDWYSMVASQDFADTKQKFGSNQIIRVVDEYGIDTATKLLSEWADFSDIKSFNDRAKEIFESE